jgi:hypothetical protein
MDLSYQVVQLEGPACHFAIEVLLKQAVAEETILCPGCYAEIQLVDEGGSTRRAQGEIEHTLSDFERQIRRLGRKKTTNEIRELRTQWQPRRQTLMRAGSNQVDEELARTLYFADNTPLINDGPSWVLYVLK